ncbi:3-deoxy-D-manno-octulosonic acid transferase [Loktanella sp. Alg231-35]|uniref:3-deoxy-D-manno-octulosonic acid transferase n=1 Tax=Loktanella sp. Alg231-35 TaxID=1922220 RepID=UPI000D561804|nr:glycosyltransferase N-terminal domain-containing protein [Loktanella sp. Alg231-35]
MTPPTELRAGWALRSYLAASHLIPLVAKPLLRRRLKRGKEHPTRWPEKLGQGLAPRPEGPLIWLHAVGLGEVLSLRGLITRMAAARPDVSFLVTTTTAASAEVFAKNAPPRTLHQFLPLDAPRYRKRFLNHFDPDLCIWAEQDLWPGFVSAIAARRIPQCIVAARMNAASYTAHQKAKGLFRDLYQAMALVTAQDQVTATHLEGLGATVRVTGSLKPAAPALTSDPATLDTLRRATAGRFVWAVAPAYPADAERARAAHDILRQTDPTALLIIVPRHPSGFADDPVPKRSQGQWPDADTPVWLCDTFGELGLIYRVAQAVLIGGTFSDIEGHNPWEAATLSTAILCGPRTANFQADFEALIDAKAAISVANSAGIATALREDDLQAHAQRAADHVSTAGAATDQLATELLQKVKR